MSSRHCVHYCPGLKDTDLSIFGVVLYYSLLIIVSPVVTFFSSKYVFEDILSLASTTANISAALCAVVMLHVALGMYIFKAYSKPTEVPDKPAKQD
ncbi:vacuolar ATPase assembly integral membrane protein VMA21 homolog [Thrips palmi]|uniref:Vacuolar ATPase assembly integral membrane protein VMA21 homolog n=1 Tax=Thrips palmi TaxID=161013 RepID=A0A6P8ZNU4_THRPL|nr:vacuolar ATPase assembly integral membrane protein VMA21 homolog [Thrips palmi]